jgi:hypothetical protein
VESSVLHWQRPGRLYIMISAHTRHGWGLEPAYSTALASGHLDSVASHRDTRPLSDSDRSRIIGVGVGEFSACLSGAWSVMGHLQFKWQGQWPLALAIAYWAARTLTRRRAVVLGLGP